MKVPFVVQAGKFALPIISRPQGQRVSVFPSRPKAAPQGPQARSSRVASFSFVLDTPKQAR
jgi:hypothetical protein